MSSRSPRANLASSDDASSDEGSSDGNRSDSVADADAAHDPRGRIWIVGSDDGASARLAMRLGPRASVLNGDVDVLPDDTDWLVACYPATVGVDSKSPELWQQAAEAGIRRVAVICDVVPDGPEFDDLRAICARVFDESVPALWLPVWSDDDAAVIGLLDLRDGMIRAGDVLAPATADQVAAVADDWIQLREQVVLCTTEPDVVSAWLEDRAGGLDWRRLTDEAVRSAEMPACVWAQNETGAHDAGTSALAALLQVAGSTDDSD